ncbi:MAG: multiple sugar transport system permease protein [Baekduia sp.]|jgi:multiple sugar transport system permease protein/putative chitobiose transport system permease protein|nr:multiple sugar transport system permease protein [Baekduia sp.]
MTAADPRDRALRLMRLIATLLVVAFFVLPMVWLVASAVRPSSETLGPAASLSARAFWPHGFSWDNFSSMVESGFLRNLLNSIIVALATVVVGLVVCSMAAFALAAIPFRGRGVVFGVVVVSFLIPFEAIAIPLSQAFRDWGLANSYTGLILPGVGNGLAIFTLRQFFLGVPSELREAAEMDGAGWWRVYWQIYLPLSRSALVGAGLILFLFQWQSFLWPVLIVDSDNMDLAPVTLAKNFGAFTSDYGRVFAEAVAISIIPAVLLLVFQRFFVASLKTSGSKG